jgi:hypothetical protein
MALLGLELSDAGIMVAGGEPVRLLKIEGKQLESPGVAIPEKKHLLVGKTAAEKAHLLPLQVLNRFWDQLNTTPLEQKSRHAQNHAEIACAHLAHIWDKVKAHGNEVFIAVPDYFGREQLGLILGMAQELSIPVKGLISLAVATSSKPYPNAMLLHLDIHLHRFEVVYLRQGERLSRETPVAVQEIGLEPLYRSWVESIAAEFVRTTRFDPLHRASSEQELYNRLADALKIFKRQESFIFEISNGKHNYRITLFRELLIQKSKAIYAEIGRLVERLRAEHGKNNSQTVLQLTHRITCLPGLIDSLSEMDRCEILQLEPGAGAFGALGFSRRLTEQPDGDGASFFTSRPWKQAEVRVSQDVPHKPSGKLQPTHLLYRNTAYLLSEKPLIIGSDDDPNVKSICVFSRKGVSGKHCTVQRSADRVVLTDYSVEGTFVDEHRVDGSMILDLGQNIRLGTSNETLKLIACAEANET